MMPAITSSEPNDSVANDQNDPTGNDSSMSDTDVTSATIVDPADPVDASVSTITLASDSDAGSMSGTPDTSSVADTASPLDGDVSGTTDSGASDGGETPQDETGVMSVPDTTVRAAFSVRATDQGN
jgi:hypothetical protein